MKAKLSALIATFVITSSLFVVFAQTDDTSNEILIESSSCEEITKKIDDKIMQYKTDEPTHTATYQMLYLKVEATSKKAEVLGYDVTKLKQNLVDLDKLIKEFETNFDDFITKFEIIKKYACDENKSATYAQSFLGTKEALDKVKDTASDIFELYQDEIRQNILGLEMAENGQ